MWFLCVFSEPLPPIESSIIKVYTVPSTALVDVSIVIPDNLSPKEIIDCYDYQGKNLTIRFKHRQPCHSVFKELSAHFRPVLSVHQRSGDGVQTIRLHSDILDVFPKHGS